jgi:hypothetical protein
MIARRLLGWALAASLVLCARTAQAAVPGVTLPALDAAPSLTGVIDASWAKAATVELGWDIQYNRPAGAEPTRAYLARYKDMLYVAFDNRLRHAPVATQRTDGSGIFNDDNDQVLLWPGGSAGFTYTFAANALGTRYQSSTENTAYTPTWSTAATQDGHGYVVTMAIPMRALRYTGTTGWRMQLVRADVTTGSLLEWAYDRRQQSAGDVLYAAQLDGIHSDAAAPRRRPRLQVYALDQAQSPQLGGDTSRLGADLSLPLTRTSSFLASFHPDYSNVETDQQTIAPTEFQRTYREVRPFFTQGASFYNVARCTPSCPYQLLYTPGIPAFREGYAVEGQEGLLGFGAFDALGTGRGDQAQSLTYRTRDQAVYAEFERVAVSRADGPRDDVSLYGGGYVNPHSHLGFFANYALDRNSAVSAGAGQSAYEDVGASLRSSSSTLSVALRKLGAGFLPADGYVTHNDIAGWASQGSKQISIGPGSFVRDVSVSAFTDRYHDRSGRVNQDDAGYQLNVDFSNSTALHVFQNNDYLLLRSGEYLPFSQNGAFFSYHQLTSTPTTALLITGPFYHGRSTYNAYTTALGLARKVHLYLEADRSAYAPGGSYVGREPSTTQWLQRASLDWQLSSRTSIDAGIRRIRGFAPPSSFAPPSTQLTDGTNLSFALHSYTPKHELYLVYGDPNVLSTRPAITAKLIWYFGAPKGT